MPRIIHNAKGRPCQESLRRQAFKMRRILNHVFQDAPHLEPRLGPGAGKEGGPASRPRNEELEAEPWRWRRRRRRRRREGTHAARTPRQSSLWSLGGEEEEEEGRDAAGTHALRTWGQPPRPDPRDRPHGGEIITGRYDDILYLEGVSGGPPWEMP